jgi:O-antigen/teichoic acid export membrane protein
MATAAGSLRVRAARGTMVNAAFSVGLQLLGFLKGFLVAGFLTATDYGVWGLLVISLGTLLWLVQVGIDDKYIQQDHPDQEAAFHLAFTLQCILAGMFMVVMAIGVPLFSLAYHEPKIIVPGLLLALAMPAVALQTPLWVYYRRMDFLTQRRLSMIDPIVSLTLTVVLAIAGAGYWSLVIGTIAGSWAAAAVAVWKSPYKLRFRYDKGTLREYATFSWPLLAGSASGVLIAQIPVLIAQRELGTAAVGAIALAGTITLYATRVDDIVTDTLYPAIARVKDRADLLLESFTKSNRLALLWGIPCGVGVALFAPDLPRVIGKHWEPAVVIIQIMGLVAAANQFGFNWTAYYRALGNTRPMAVAGLAMLVAVLALTPPLILSDGLEGYAIGMGAATGVFMLVRWYYLFKLFPGFKILAHAVRALAPTVPATAAVFAVRAVESGPRTASQAALEVAAFGVIVVVATVLSERALIREVMGYLRGRTAPTPA